MDTGIGIAVGMFAVAVGGVVAVSVLCRTLKSLTFTVSNQGEAQPGMSAEDLRRVVAEMDPEPDSVPAAIGQHTFEDVERRFYGSVATEQELA